MLCAQRWSDQKQFRVHFKVLHLQKWRCKKSEENLSFFLVFAGFRDGGVPPRCFGGFLVLVCISASVVVFWWSCFGDVLVVFCSCSTGLVPGL